MRPDPVVRGWLRRLALWSGLALSGLGYHLVDRGRELERFALLDPLRSDRRWR